MNGLEKAAIEVRKQVISMHARANASHVGSALSCVDILVALYEKILTVFPGEPRHPLRDRFILSKGHAVSALYATLARRGLLEERLLETFHMDGGALSGHPDRLTTPFVEVSTGSLGHGLPIGVGMAYALKRDGNPARVFVLMSDGEIQEGTVWESANQAQRLRLDNLVAIVDVNKLQAYERTGNIVPRAVLRARWEAFGWAAEECDGHRIQPLVRILGSVPFTPGRPSVVIADTVKGKGIAEFEDKMEWHYRAPKLERLGDYLRELDEKSVH